MGKTVHESVVTYIRQAAEQGSQKLRDSLVPLSDEQLIRLMFSNYRGGTTESRGLRLTNFGLQIMNVFFRAYRIGIPEDQSLLPRYILYLDAVATMPYYCSEKDGFVIFETILGTKVMLAGGCIDILIEMDEI